MEESNREAPKSETTGASSSGIVDVLGMSREQMSEYTKKIFGSAKEREEKKKKKEQEELERKAKEEAEKKNQDANAASNLPSLRQIHPPKPAKANVTRNVTEELNEAVKKAHSSSSSEKLEGATALRKLLSVETNPPAQEVIDSGVVPRLVSFLDDNSDHQLQFEACWALTNIASGTSAQTHYVMNLGILPKLIKLLNSDVPENVKEQAVWALGNFAGDSAQVRDLCLQHGALDAVVGFLTESKLSISAMRNGVWTLSNLFRSKPSVRNLDYAKKALSVLQRFVYSTDNAILVDTLWSLSYITDGDDDRIMATVETGIVRRIVELMYHSDVSVVVPALRTIGNIVSGNDAATQSILNVGALPALYSLISAKSSKKGVLKEAFWALSNVAAGTREQIQGIIDVGFIPLVIQSIKTAPFEVKKEALWVLANICSGGSKAQVQLEHLMDCGALKAFAECIKGGTDIVFTKVALEGLEKLFQVAREDAPQMFEDCGGLDSLEMLQSSPNPDIADFAARLLGDYFQPIDDA